MHRALPHVLHSTDQATTPCRDAVRDPHGPPGPENAQRGVYHIERLRDDFLGYTRQLQQDFGDCVYYRVGLVPVFQFTHPQQIQEVLVTKARSFRKSDRFRRVFRRWLGNGLLLNEGDSWSRQRQLVQPSFQPQALPAYAETIVRLTGELLDRLGDTEFDAPTVFHRLALLIAGEVLLGTDLADVADRFVEEVAAMQSMAYSDFTARSRAMAGHPQLREGINFLNGVVTNIISRRQQALNERRDVLGALMQAADGERQNAVAPRQLRDEIMMLLLAGSSTMGTALTWAAYTLASHPEVQDQVCDEADRVLGDRPATSEDVKSLTMLESALLETLRLYPPAYTTSRQAIKPVEIGGYQLPAGAQVHLIPLLMHRDPRWFDDPLAFRPERFVGEARQSIPRFAFLPFGAGPRACVGGGLAITEGILALATIVKRFRLELADGQQEPELDPLISLQPKGGLRLKLSACTD